MVTPSPRSNDLPKMQALPGETIFGPRTQFGDLTIRRKTKGGFRGADLVSHPRKKYVPLFSSQAAGHSFSGAPLSCFK